MGDAKLDYLRETSLFSTLDRKDLALVAEITTEVQVPAGTVLVHEGHIGHDAFVVVEGTVAVSIGGQQVATLGPGEMVGELSLLLREVRQATVTAATDVNLLVIEPNHFDELLDRVPAICRQLVVSLARRLRDADQKLYR
jgi:CRP-like cAMP-binding protein